MYVYIMYVCMYILYMYVSAVLFLNMNWNIDRVYLNQPANAQFLG